MQFDEADTSEVKEWVVKRLEDISDADADVLADYVIALVKSDEEEAQVRANCLENLEDFLRDHTEKFVDDVFTAIRTKSYKSGHAASASTPSANEPNGKPAAPFNPPSGPAALQQTQNGRFGGQQQQQQQSGPGGQSRKRGFHERETSESGDPHYGRNSGGDRAVKQMRRGGGQNARGGRGNHPGQGPMNGGSGALGMSQNMPQMPAAPPGFPPLDPSDPMTAIMAMQAMGFPPMPGFPFPGSSGSPGGFGGFQSPPPVQKTGERCKDYDTKGFCAKGSMCPHDHGSDHLVVPGGSDEYDPSQSSLVSTDGRDKDSSRPARGGPNNRGRGRSRGHHGSGGGGGGGGGRGNQRAAFSSSAPNFDRSNTSIVIEQIPEDKFSDEAVREFFAEFGEIESVNMQPYKRLAVVKFRDYNGARSAYDSPKVIFDNRFVKVYWYKPDAVLPNTAAAATAGKSGDESMQTDKKTEDEEMMDPEEFEKKQAEAQKAYEEKMKKLEEAKQAKEELDKRIKAQAEERKKLMEKLATKTGTNQSNSSPSPGPNGAASTNDAHPQSPEAPTKSSSAAEALRAKLAELEAEAETLGLGPEEATSLDGMSSYPYRGGRGRGGGRGARGFDRGRGRGSWRGFGAPAGGAVARLDNRPKSVRVVPTEEQINFNDTSADEALRAHLFSVGEFSSITPAHTNSDESKGEERADCAVVAFHQRYIAEMLISSISPPAGNGSIPGLGKVKFEWVANPPPSATAATPSANNVAKQTPRTFHEGADDNAHEQNNVGPMGANGTDSEMNGHHHQQQQQQQQQHHNHTASTAPPMVDFDVAEDDEDRWMR